VPAVEHESSGRRRRVAALASTALPALVLDQVTKAVVRASLPVGEARPLLPGVIELLHVENTGAAFSMGEGATMAFVVVAVVVVAGAVALAWREPLPAWLSALLGCVVGGGVGNMVDRIAAGSVTDFLATTFMDFPVFNVADIFVTCGIAASLVGYWWWDSRRGGDAS
jgi:signal peptidase II